MLGSPLKKSKSNIFAKSFPSMGVREGEYLDFGSAMRVKETSHLRYTEVSNQYSAGLTGIGRTGKQTLNPSIDFMAPNPASLVVASALPSCFAPPSLQTRTTSSPGVSCVAAKSVSSTRTTSEPPRLLPSLHGFSELAVDSPAHSEGVVKE